MSTGSKPKNANRGYLAPNKKAHDRQPDWRGKASVDGKDWLVSGWFKDVTNNGETARIISFEFTDPATLPQRSPPAQPAQQASPAEGGATGSSTSGGAPGSAAFDDIFSGSGSF